MTNPTAGRARLRARRTLLALSTVLASGLAAPALAQSPGSGAPPPVRSAIDENGVDVIRGTFNIGTADISIGGDGHKGLRYSRSSIDGRWTESSVATIDGNGSEVVVTIDGRSDGFTASNGVYTSTEGNGSTLVHESGGFVYTNRNGDIAEFESSQNSFYSIYRASLGRITRLVYADGTQLNFYYKFAEYCGSGIENGSCPGQTRYAVRLQSVTSTDGYMLKFSYLGNGDEVLTNATYRNWAVPASVSAINTGRQGCDPNADTCAAVQGAPKANYSLSNPGGGTELAVTDAANRTARYTKEPSFGAFRYRRPGSNVDDILVTYGGLGVASVTRFGVTHSYSFADAGNQRTATVTDPNGRSRVYVSDTTTNLLKSYRNEGGALTTYDHDGVGRVTKVTSPEGNYTQLTYDARGNLTATEAVPKAGSGLAPVTSTAAYPAGCDNVKTCNKPVSTTDARSATTEYAYDGAHGGITSVRLPAPTGGAVRPEVRYGYALVGGAHRPVTVSQCRTGATCIGSADESRTTTTFGGASTNYLPASVTAAAGDGSVSTTMSYGYDYVGHVVAVDGALPGSGDVTDYQWSAARELTAVVSADPDGGGPLKRRSTVYHYLPNGLRDSVSVGTVDANGVSNFQPLQVWASDFDANGRKTRDVFSASGATYSVTDYAYNALGQVECRAVRMNPAAFGAVPGACNLGAQGSDGPDRITRATYDEVGRLKAVETARGTAEASSDTTTYTANGQVQTVSDGNGNTTTYLYDGFDRLVTTSYPGGSYERLGYDANGNVINRRLRDGRTLGFTYDALNRVTVKQVPDGCAPIQSGACAPSWSTRDVFYGYDLSGRLRSAQYDAIGGEGVTVAHDGLGRVTSSTTAMGGTSRTVSYEYDAGGRRTRVTHPDGVHFTTSYDTLNQATNASWWAPATGTVPFMAITYDNLGRRTDINRASSFTGYNFGGTPWLKNMDQRFAGGAGNTTYAFGQNAAGQITSVTRDNDAYAFTGHYDVDRAYGVNGLNQLTSAGSTGIGYDANGNLITSGPTSYGYDAENRMVSASTSNGTTLIYDPLGRLWQTASPAFGKTQFTYDGDHVAVEYDGDTGGIRRRHMWGPGTDEPVLSDEGGAMNCSGTRFLHTDERGSVVALADCHGNRTAGNSYDEYGIPGQGNQGRFQYTGQAWLPDLGMYYYKARMYSPTLGRFMQTDPIGYGDGMNWYNYVGGDPVNRVDPSGLSAALKPPLKPIADPNPSDNVEGSEVVVTGQRAGYNIAILGAINHSGPIGNLGDMQNGAVMGDEVTVTATRPQNIQLKQKCSMAQNAGQWLGRNISKLGALGTNIGLGGTAVGLGTTAVGINVGATGNLPTGLAIGFAGLGITDISAQVTAYSGLVTVAGASISAISGSGKPAAVEGLARLSTRVIPSGPLKDFAQEAISKGLDAIVPEIRSCTP